MLQPGCLFLFQKCKITLFQEVSKVQWIPLDENFHEKKGEDIEDIGRGLYENMG